MSSDSLKCSRPGCGKSYDPNAANGNSCSYHPGTTIFHEGLKSWSCCNELPGHRPVLDFDEFLNIPGCTTGKHITEIAPSVPSTIRPSDSSSTTPQAAGVGMTVEKTSDGKEIYSTPLMSSAFSKPAVRAPSPPPTQEIQDEEDDPNARIPEGAECRRNGCKARFVSDAESRQGDGQSSVCQYHPMPPLFREGSKGYLCCKPKVLEFEEFLKIEGCKTGRHLFAPKPKVANVTEELILPRIDHYQTPAQVIVSVFAKQVDKESSTVAFDERQVHLNLNLPGGKRCVQTLELYDTIVPASSSHKIFGTKESITLSQASS